MKKYSYKAEECESIKIIDLQFHEEVLFLTMDLHFSEYKTTVKAACIRDRCYWIPSYKECSDEWWNLIYSEKLKFINKREIINVIQECGLTDYDIKENEN